MSSSFWRYVSASVIGTSHLKLGGVCQDSNLCFVIPKLKDGDVLVGIVSDGAGSASKSDIGSMITCKAIKSCIQNYLSDSQLQTIDKTTVEKWIEDVQSELIDQAHNDNCALRDYACTILTAIVGDEFAVFFQIGDGSIVVADTEELNYGHIFWPDRGEYENTTYFITETDYKINLQFENVKRKIIELSLFSDGLQRIALDFAKSMPHEAFFKGLFPFLRKSEPENSIKLSQSLQDFLSSSRVNERTDDDKSLILATRLTGLVGT